MGYAMERDDHARSIHSVFAMDEDTSVLRRRDDQERAAHSLVLRPAPVRKRDIEVIEPESARLGFFGFGGFARAAQIDDRVDAEFAEATQTTIARLTTAIKPVSHLLEFRQLSVARRVLSKDRCRKQH